MLQWDISLGSQLCNKTDNRFILLLLMGPIGILEKKAGGKEQQKHVPMICSVPAHQFCCFQSDSHFKIQCFSYVSLDIYPFELPCKGSISRAEVLGGPTKFRAARILPLGSNCPLSCSCQSHGNHWNTRALEYFCQRESLKKAWKRFWKEKQMNPRLFRSLWKKLWSQKEVPEPCPGCCAWGHTNSVSAPLSGATESKDLFFFCTLFFAKGNFFDDRRVILSSSPSDKRLKLLSMQRRFGFPFNLNRQWWKEQWAQHPRDKELKQQFGKVSWPGARGLCLTDELPVVHTSRLGIDMLID